MHVRVIHYVLWSCMQDGRVIHLLQCKRHIGRCSCLMSRPVSPACITAELLLTQGMPQRRTDCDIRQLYLSMGCLDYVWTLANLCVYEHPVQRAPQAAQYTTWLLVNLTPTLQCCWRSVASQVSSSKERPRQHLEHINSGSYTQSYSGLYISDPQRRHIVGE